MNFNIDPSTPSGGDGGPDQEKEGNLEGGRMLEIDLTAEVDEDVDEEGEDACEEQKVCRAPRGLPLTNR
jgi:hypothetical protein